MHLSKNARKRAISEYTNGSLQTPCCRISFMLFLLTHIFSILYIAFCTHLLFYQPQYLLWWKSELMSAWLQIHMDGVDVSLVTNAYGQATESGYNTLGVMQLLRLCFCTKMASEAVSEHKIFLFPGTPLLLHAYTCIHALHGHQLSTHMHNSQSDNPG